MSPRHDNATDPYTARVPADVDRPDTLVFGLTGRQLIILGAAGLGLWAAWSLLHTLVPGLLLLVAGIVVAGTAAAAALARRDGIGLDAWLIAAARFVRQPRRMVATDTRHVTPAPAWIATTNPRDARQVPAPLRLPARGIAADGTIDLGPAGAARLAAAGTLNFTLRTPAEQDALVAAFGAALNSLHTPVQILIRGHRVDLDALAQATCEAASGLPHPRLEAAARDYAAYLTDQAQLREVRQRSVVLAVHAESPGAAAAALDQLLAAVEGCGVAAVALDGPATTAVLADCADPFRPDIPAAAAPAAPGTPVGYRPDPPAVEPAGGAEPDDWPSHDGQHHDGQVDREQVDREQVDREQVDDGQRGHELPEDWRDEHWRDEHWRDEHWRDEHWRNEDCRYDDGRPGGIGEDRDEIGDAEQIEQGDDRPW